MSNDVESNFTPAAHHIVIFVHPSIIFELVKNYIECETLMRALNIYGNIPIIIIIALILYNHVMKKNTSLCNSIHYILTPKSIRAFSYSPLTLQDTKSTFNFSSLRLLYFGKVLVGLSIYWFQN